MSERGAAPVELALGVLLLLIPTAVLVLSLGPWLDRHSFVRTAAAEAARWVVISNGDEQTASRRVAEMAANSGLDPATVRVGFCDGPQAPASAPPVSACADPRLERGGVVTATVEAEVEPVRFAFLRLGPAVTSYRHAEPVEPYRSLP